jgi:hypothetical protein
MITTKHHLGAAIPLEGKEVMAHLQGKEMAGHPYDLKCLIRSKGYQK